MARGSKSKSRDRDAYPSLAQLAPAQRPLRAINLSQIQDLRSFYPEPDFLRAPLNLQGQKVSTVASPNRNAKTRRSRTMLPYAVGFDQPTQVLVCVRRKIRREVLFAKKRHRGASRKKRRNSFSNIRCR